MRSMLTISIPVEAGNEAIKDGSLSKIIGELMDRLKPEAAYFTAQHGERTAIIFFDLKDPSDIPVISEPLFMGFDAALDLKPVMNAEDLQKGLSQLSM